MPYLHERKIVLNRIKTNTKYFYSSFQLEGKSHWTNDQIESYLEITKSKEVTLINCMNLLESKIYLYLENGVIAYRHDFTHIK